MNSVLVVNAGSSSIKYQVIDVETDARIAAGAVERIGERESTVTHRADGGQAHVEQGVRIADHTAAFAALTRAFAAAGQPIESLGIIAVGHRVVQGGSTYQEPTLIDDEVAADILRLADLAPLHNPGHYEAIVAARTAFPEVPHVGVFDTAFHQSIPQRAYTYAIDPEVAAEHGVRRYGFHGISYQIVSQRAAAVIGRPVHELKQIVLHLGNGASACAIDRGASVATSMGFTPLEGLVMGSRSGDIDPGVLLHLMRAGASVDELDRLLNQQSGILGFTGSNDMRDLLAGVAQGSEQHRLALSVYITRIRHYVGAYLFELGGADAIVFTAGVGEHNPVIREEVCAGLEWFGIAIDPELNSADSSEARIVSTADSRVTVLVVPTDEEIEIARQTWMLVNPR